MSDDPYSRRLHEAVIADDHAVVAELCHDPLLRRVRNDDGLTPLEIANYLGRDRCIRLLNPKYRRIIYAALRNDNFLSQLDAEQFSRQFGVTYRPHLYFDSYSMIKKVQQNCPWTIKKTFLGEENRLLAQQFESYIEGGRVANVSIRWIDDVLGYGIFANSDLPPGTFVGEFTGRIRQLSRWRPQYNPYCFHYPTSCFSWNYMVIDASIEGNEMRFINHSDIPNLQPQWLCRRSLLHMVFFTNRSIPAGSQLTYNYGQDFWRHRQKVEVSNFQPALVQWEAAVEKAR